MLALSNWRFLLIAASVAYLTHPKNFSADRCRAWRGIIHRYIVLNMSRTCRRNAGKYQIQVGSHENGGHLRNRIVAERPGAAWR